MATQPRDRLAEPSSPASNIPTARPLTPGEFNTAMAHLYRGEITRANTWRARLDGTTNWAVLTTGATLSFAFSSPENTHVMILLNSLLICFFLFIEARRYRYYDLWRTRVRLMETDFFADLLVPNQHALDDAHWRELLANDLLFPQFTMNLWEAMGRRLRRNYSWIFGVLVLSWMVKVWVHPFSIDMNQGTDAIIDTLLVRAAIGPLSGPLVLAIGVIFNGLLILLGIMTSTRLNQRWRSRDEVQSRDETRESLGATERKWWE
jgi:uncharacterized membrane protein